MDAGLDAVAPGRQLAHREALVAHAGGALGQQRGRKGGLAVVYDRKVKAGMGLHDLLGRTLGIDDGAGEARGEAQVERGDAGSRTDLKDLHKVAVGNGARQDALALAHAPVELGRGDGLELVVEMLAVLHHKGKLDQVDPELLGQGPCYVGAGVHDDAAGRMRRILSKTAAQVVHHGAPLRPRLPPRPLAGPRGRVRGKELEHVRVPSLGHTEPEADRSPYKERW